MIENYMVMPWYDHGMTEDETIEYYKRLAEKEDMMYEEGEF